MTTRIRPVGHRILVGIALLLALVALAAVSMVATQALIHPGALSARFGGGPAMAIECPSALTHC